MKNVKVTNADVLKKIDRAKPFAFEMLAVEPYKGRFGEGIIIDMPDYNSEWCSKRMYFIKGGENNGRN